jgi:hypothetical protein
VIIALGQDDTLKQRLEHPSRGEQILKRAQRPRPRRLRRGLQIGPNGRDHQMAAVRQDQDQLKAPAPVHPTHQFKRLSLPGMRAPDDPHRRRVAIEVGLVSCVPSGRSRMTG